MREGTQIPFEAERPEFARQEGLAATFSSLCVDLPPGWTWPFRPAMRATKLNTRRMKHVLRKLGITGQEYKEWSGGQSFRAFIEANPRWTMRAFEVLIIENAEEIRKER